MNTQKRSVLHRIPIFGIFFSAIFFAVLLSHSAAAQPFLTFDAQEHIIPFKSNDLVQEFRIPSSLTNGYIYLEATGADGGRKRNGSTIAGNGGQGAIMGAWFEIGTGVNQLPPGAEVVFIIGERGQNINNIWAETAGGGGGTGIFYKRFDDQYTLLAVAGGGGGGYSDCCTDSDAGFPAEITRCPFEDHNQYCKIEYLQWYEVGDNCTTGGGLINDIEDYFRPDLANGEWDDCGSNERAGLRGWPGATHYLSNPVKPTGGAGGEGGRSGGFRVNSKGGFGVGGGAGGAPGNQRVGGGGFTPGTNGNGAGSFLNHIFVGTPTKIKRGNTSDPQHGQVKYQIFPVEPVAVCNDVTVTVDQNGSVTVEAIDAGVESYDPNGLDLSYRLLDLDDGIPKESLDFDCSNVGQPYETTLFVYTLFGGNPISASTCSTTIRVKNKLSMNCQDAVVRLDDNGEATLDPSSIDNGSSVSCGGSIQSLTLSQNSFTCADIGEQTITLTATDNNGDTESCTATLTVQEVHPIAKCKDITVDLENNERIRVYPHQIDDISASLCSGVLDEQTYIRGISPAWVNCNQINTSIPATLTIRHKDGGFTTSCTSNITVIQDLSKAAKCKDLTVTLDQSGQNTLNVELGNIDFDDGSWSGSDFCEIKSVRKTWSQESFTCADVGETPVTLTLKDASNDALIDECISIVTVKDKAGPIANCKPISIQMPNGPSPTATLSPSDIDNGSYDLCGSIATQSLWDPGMHPADDKQYTLIIDTEGASSAREISWTVTSGGITYASGDSYTTERTITETFSLSPGGYQLNIYDSFGDALCFGKVCAGYYRLEDEGGNVVILGGNDWDHQDSESFYVTGGTFTNQINYSCQHLGTRQVVLYQEDEYGNGSICQTTVTIEQDLSEAAKCKDVLVTLDQSGQNRIWVNRHYDNDFDNGSEMNSCLGQHFRHWTPNQEFFDFSCSDIGEHPVTLSLKTYDGDLVDECISIITVRDQAGPMAQCQPITVQLPQSGVATLSASELDDGSYDVCASVSSMQVWDPMKQSFPEQSFTLTIKFDQAPRDNSWTVTSAGNTIVSSGGLYDYPFATKTITETFDLPPGAYEFNFYDSYGDGFYSQYGGGFFRLEDDQGKVLLQGGVDDWDFQKSINFTVEKSAFSDKLTYDCTDLGTHPVVLLVRDSYDNGAICKTTVTVEDNSAATAICKDLTVDLESSGQYRLYPGKIDGGSFSRCGQSLEKWILDPESQIPQDFLDLSCSDVGTKTFTLKVSKGTPESEAICTANVTILPPVGASTIAVCQDITVELDQAGHYRLLPGEIDGGSVAECGSLEMWIVDPESQIPQAYLDLSCSDAGSRSITLQVNSESPGSEDICVANITVLAPIKAICKPTVSVNLDENGQASISPEMLDNGSYSACGLITSRSIDLTAVDCSLPEGTKVTLTVTDNNGLSSSCQSSLEIRKAICKDVTIQLNSSGQYRLYPNEIAGASAEYCSVGDMLFVEPFYPLTLEYMDFTCSNIGTKNVEIVVLEERSPGKTHFCTAKVTIEAGPPQALCQPTFEVSLDQNGQASISPEMLDDGSYVPCGDLTLNLDKTNFDCSDKGENTVTLTISDENGRTNTCETVVNVTDPKFICNQAPIAVCKDITVPADQSCQASITPSSLDGGSSDPDGDPLIFSLEKVTFGLGVHTVVLTVSDGLETDQCTATITVEDVTKPVPDVQTLPTITGECSASVAEAPTATDNCAGTITGTTTDPLSYSSQGTHIITWTFDDGNGNVATQNQTVIVNDVSRPVPDQLFLPIINGECSVTVTTAPTATDNCGGTITATTTDPLTYTVHGVYTIRWTFDDGNGNVIVQTQYVTVFDDTPPVPDVASLPTITGECSAVIGSPPTATDNCGGTIIGQMESPPSFFGTDTETITWIYDDGHGNITKQTQTVIVRDVSPPVPDQASLPELRISCLEEIGENPPTATDACTGQVTGRLLGTVFFPSPGRYTITWTFRDGKGNRSTQEQVVIYGVEDNSFQCKDITISLDDKGEASISPQMVYDGYISDCIPLMLTLDRYDFDCTNLGDNTVTLTRVNLNGANTSCTATVTVEGESNCNAGSPSNPWSFPWPGWSSLSTQQSATTQASKMQLQAFPNPFRDQLTVKWSVSNSDITTVQVFNLQGQMVRELFRGYLDSGEQQEQWDGTDFRGAQLPSGIYLIRLQTGEEIISKKLLLQR